MVKRIITYGTFDLFHVGHVRILKRLKALGDELYVGCATDEFNSVKGKKSIIRFEERIEILSCCRYVDRFFAEKNWHQKPDDIRRFDAHVFGMGSDWEGEFDWLSDICKVVYLRRTEHVSTTQLIHHVKASPARSYA